MWNQRRVDGVQVIDLRAGGRGVEAAGSASNDGDAWRRFGAAERSACGVAQHLYACARRWIESSAVVAAAACCWCAARVP